MVRKMIIVREDGSSPVLTECEAGNEAQLQELMKDYPDLLPVDEFGMTGPLMVVGRETVLASGAVDLLALARSGELLLVEFKTGPQNTDFRHIVAQMLDYGSHLWRLSYEEFEAAVVRRYIDGNRCTDNRLKHKRTIEDAARAMWADLSEEELAYIKERISQQLSTGAFHYVAVAQRFTTPMQRTVDYLNSVAPAPRFYAVELVRFSAEDMSAFEARTILRPEAQRVERPGPTSEDAFLDKINDDAYRKVIHELLEVCGGLGLRFGWGTVGTSIRLTTADRAEPLTIGWLFPPGRSGWMGLSDLTLGFDQSSAGQTPSIKPALDKYVAQVGVLEGAEQVRAKSLKAFHLGTKAVVQNCQQIAEILAQLVGESESGA